MDALTAPVAQSAMTVAMGTAVPSCSTPTRAAAPAATLNCRLPISAEALPAWRPWPAMAEAEALGMMQPRQAVAQNSGTSSGHSASVWAWATTSIATAKPSSTQTIRRSQ